MNERDVEWAAGLFEGEGCFSIHRNKYITKKGEKREYLSLLLSVSSTDKDVLLEFQRILGGPVYPIGARKNHKFIWQWKVFGDPALEVAWKMMPYLLSRRQTRFMEITDQIRDSKASNADRWA